MYHWLFMVGGGVMVYDDPTAKREIVIVDFFCSRPADQVRSAQRMADLDSFVLGPGFGHFLLANPHKGWPFWATILVTRQNPRYLKLTTPFSKNRPADHLTSNWS